MAGTSPRSTAAARMMNFVPPLLDDELMYGLVGRWNARSGFKTPTRFMVAAFGPTYDMGSARRSLPVEIKSACGVALDLGAATERLTLLPFYRPFMEPALVKLLCELPRSGASKPVRLPSVGKLSISSPALMYCAICCEEQFRTAGVVTWSRAHNLPGVSTCWAHGCRLGSVKVSAPILRFVLPPPNPTLLPRASRREHWYAMLARDHLLAGGDALTAHQRAEAWGAVTRSRGESVRSGTFRVAEAFLKAYPVDFLSQIGIGPSVDAIAQRIRLLASGRLVASPVFALLLSQVTHDGGIAGFLRAAAKCPVGEPRPDS